MAMRAKAKASSPAPSRRRSTPSPARRSQSPLRLTPRRGQNATEQAPTAAPAAGGAPAFAERVLEVFRGLDPAGTHSISREALLASLAELQFDRNVEGELLQGALDRCVADEQGNVDYTEFLALAADPHEAEVAEPAAQGAPRQARRTGLKLDVGHTGFRDVLKMAANRIGWDIVMHSGGTVIWVDMSNDATTRLANRGKAEWISWIPGVQELCGKVALAEALQARDAEFWPRSWRVPGQDANAIAREAFRAGAHTTLIVKPDEGSQGSGIGLAQSRAELTRLINALPVGHGAIVQEYVDRPLLLDGCKWDARIYALMMPSQTAEGEFECFLAQEGLVRVCVEQYAAPEAANLQKTSMHLTNYSLNKFSDKFEHSENAADANHGCKRLLTAVLDRLQAEGVGELLMAAQIWEELGALSRQTVDAIAAELAAAPPRCFHVLGLDVLLDERGRTWLLEANYRPSLLIDEVHPLNTMSRAEQNRVMAAANRRGADRWGKPCRCALHHRLHEHQLSPVDAAVKSPVVEGALQIAHRAKRGGEAATWAEGTIYRLV